MEENPLRDRLRSHIRDYVYRQRHTCQATAAELVVMACIMSDVPLSQAEISSWITSSFENMSSIVAKTVPATDGRSQRQDNVQNACKAFDTPVYVVDMCSYDGYWDEADQTHDWTAAICAANVFLRRRLFPYPASRTPFRIMDLPAELRAKIFGFALLLPRSGIWCEFRRRYGRERGQFQLLMSTWTAERDTSTLTDFYPGLWNIEKATPFSEPENVFRVDLARHLAPLCVSKTWYKEAMPSFYSTNTIYLPHSYACMTLLENVPASHLKHIENIAWRLPQLSPPMDLVQKVASLPRLRRLAVVTSNISVGVGTPRPAPAIELRSVRGLTAIRNLKELTLFGPIEAFEEHLRPKMVGPGREVEDDGVFDRVPFWRRVVSDDDNLS